MKSLIILSTLVAFPLEQNYSNANIIDGMDADISDFPFQVSIKKDGKHSCGGSIISSNWIVTAASCLEGYAPNSPISMRIGSANLDDNGQLVEAVQFFQHPDYNPTTLEQDVGLLNTENPMTGENISPIEIAYLNEPLSAGAIAIVSGWGYLNSTINIPPRDLQFGELFLLTFKNCKQTYSDHIYDSNFCAYVPFKSICYSDTGGPVTIQGRLFGVVSWGSYSCEQFGFPSVFARLPYSSIRSWIEEITGL